MRAGAGVGCLAATWSDRRYFRRIDSSLVAASLCGALGKEKFSGLFMPEHHSSDDALRLGQLLSTSLGIETVLEHSPCSGRGRVLRATRRSCAHCGTRIWEWKCKLVLPSILDSDRLNITRLTVQNQMEKSNSAFATCRIPSNGCCHQLQAAHPQDDRVLPR